MFELRNNLGVEECVILINSGLQEIHNVYEKDLNESFTIDFANTNLDTYYRKLVDSYYNKVNSVEENLKEVNKNLSFFSLIELNIGIVKTS